MTCHCFVRPVRRYPSKQLLNYSFIRLIGWNLWSYFCEMSLKFYLLFLENYVVLTRNFPVKCFIGHCKKKQRQRSVLKRGQGGRRGAYLPLSHAHTPTLLKFSKIPLAIFTVSSVSVIDLGQCICWQAVVQACSGSPASWCLLGSSWVVLGQKMHSEVADVTGKVKYISKNIFGTKRGPPQIFICWAQPPWSPALPPM